MDFSCEETPLKDLFVISPKRIEDARGFLMEVYRLDVLEAAGIRATFVQENHSRSSHGVLRGLHFQWDKPLGKFTRIINGSAFLVAVDIRKKSPTLGKWFGLELSAENKKILWVPPGFAAGFCVTGDIAEVEYQYTAFYNPAGESNIVWNDSDLAIAWPMQDPTLSERDKNAQTFKEWLTRPESDFFN